MLYQYLYHRILSISELSTYEYSQIIATFYYHNDDKFGCDRKAAKFYKDDRRKNPKADEEHFRKMQGCVGERKSVMYQFESIGYYGCLCRFRTNMYGFYWSAYQAFKQGTMPYPGSFSEQPSKIIEVFNLLDNLVEDLREEHAKKESKKNGR